MPVPLIARQRALSRIGEIRLGDEKHDGKVGRKLETFRLTSQHKEILDQAAVLYGGEVKEWESPTGQAWQVITTRSCLPVLVIPGYSLRRAYEKWAGPSKRERVCDGEEEVLSGQPCICNAQGKDECKLLTRLMVLLPETGTSLGWQLSSTGETAADELDLAMKIAEGIAQGRPFVPGTLSLTQRKGQLNGQATRFVVPVLGFNPQPQALAAGEIPRALPSGYVPLAGNGGNGVSLEEGLVAAETQTATRTSRSAAPIPEHDDILFGEEPVPVEEEAPVEKPLTLAQAKTKMNALVGQLRDGGSITTENLYVALAKERNVDVDTMIALATKKAKEEGTQPPKDDAGDLHWAPLRDSLTLEEARALHARLARLWVKEQAVAAA
jgi:hypothetical protein